MPEFQYRAKDDNGISHAGTITAASRHAAVSQLRERGWVVVALEAILQSETQRRRRSWLAKIPPRNIQVEVTLQELSMMIRSGMTLLAAISSIIEQARVKSLERIWSDISEQIQSGRGLSESMSRHKCFPEYVLRLVQVGEQTGNLDVVLTRAARAMRSRRDARESFASATIYPLLVVVLAMGVTAYMVLYLIPRLQEYLQSLGRDMPAMTQSLINISFWLRDYYPVLIVFALAGIGLLMTVYSSRDGRLILDRLTLRIPVIGRLVRLAETSTFARSLSMMLKSGITLTEGLGATEKILTNRFLRQTVLQARDKIIRGSNLVDALNVQNAFGSMLARMATVGQQTGELDLVLDELADLHDSQFRSLVKRVNAIVTPLITIAIGGVVGYVYIAFFMALVAAGS